MKTEEFKEMTDEQIVEQLVMYARVSNASYQVCALMDEASQRMEKLIDRLGNLYSE